MTAERDDEWERQHLYVLFFDDNQGLGLCGCNRPQDAYSLIRDLMNLLPWYETWPQTDQLIGTSGAAHIVQCQLDRIGLVEHGGTIGGAWATDKGRYARWMLNRHEYETDGDRPGVDDAGYPHEGQPCTPECWIAPAGLDLSDPEPDEPRPSPTERLRELSAQQEAAMSPGQRAASDMLANVMLYGQHPAPELGYILPPVEPAEGESLWNEMLYGAPPKPLPPGSSTHTGLFDAVGGVTPDSVEWPVGIEAGAWSTVRSDEIVFPDPGYVGRLQRGTDPLETVVNAVVADEVRDGHSIAKAKWAPADCTCPWPWPMSGGRHILTSCPHCTAPARPVTGRNAQIGCQRYDSGSWVHGDPHDCPPYARGQR